MQRILLLRCIDRNEAVSNKRWIYENNAFLK